MVLMPRLIASLLVLAALVPWAGARASTEPEGPPAGIVRLLQDRGRAYETQDRDLLEGTLVPGPFRREQLDVFDRAGAVRFGAYQVAVSTRFSGDIAGARVRSLYPGAAVAAYHATEETVLDGVENRPFVEEVFLTFTREESEAGDPYDGWRLASDTDFDVLGGLSARYPWHFGDVEAVRSDRFLMLAHPSQVPELRGIVRVAEEAYDEVAAFWPRPVGERYVIVVPRTADDLRRMIRATVDLSKFVAFAGGSVRRDPGWEPAGVRLYVNLERFRVYGEQGQRVTLGHELIHAVTRPAAGPFVPFWVEEGLAMMGSEPEEGIRHARGRPVPHAFPTDDAFFVGPVGDIVRTYRRSQVALEVLRAREGIDGVADFYEALGAAREAPGTETYHVARALRESVGWDASEWERAWLERLR